MPTINVTRARKEFGPLLDDVVRAHRPRVLERNNRDRFLLVSSEDAKRLIGGRFQPEVLMEEGAVSIWLPELSIYGRGRSFDEAKGDLIEEVRAYVDEYLQGADRYAVSPNRGEHFPLVVRALLADAEGRLADLLFAPPPGAPQPRP